MTVQGTDKTELFSISRGKDFPVLRAGVAPAIPLRLQYAV